MRVALFALFPLCLAGCGQSGSSTNIEKAEVQPKAQDKPNSTVKQRKAIIDNAVKGLQVERDKMEKISLYTAPKRNRFTTRLEAYISLPDGRGALLHGYAVYYGEHWLFYDHIKVVADDEIIYEKHFPYGAVKQDNGRGSVAEIADYLCSPSDIAALEKLSAAKEATVRFSSKFSGKDRYEDHQVTAQEFSNLKKIITSYRALSKL
jgi:hypothetical protein